MIYIVLIYFLGYIITGIIAWEYAEEFAFPLALVWPIIWGIFIISSLIIGPFIIGKWIRNKIKG